MKRQEMRKMKNAVITNGTVAQMCRTFQAHRNEPSRLAPVCGMGEINGHGVNPVVASAAANNRISEVIGAKATAGERKNRG